jgi:hypothetical protein
VAEEVGRRRGRLLWRFVNTGARSEIDPIHLVRAIIGRDRIIEVEGGRDPPLYALLRRIGSVSNTFACDVPSEHSDPRRRVRFVCSSAA